MVSRPTHIANATPSTSNNDNFAGGLIFGVLGIDLGVDITGHAFSQLEGLGVCVGVTHCG